MPRILLTGKTAQYEILKQVAYNPTYRLYLCRDVASGGGHLLQIATERVSNGGLERAAFILNALMRASRYQDKKYAEDHEGHVLHFDRLFPEVIETFISPEQQDRRVNILAFTDVPDVARLLPLSNLKSKDRLRIDPKTNAWILGRILKLLTLVHSEGIAVRNLGSNNVLLEREKHFAIVLDWSSAWMHQHSTPTEDVIHDIAQAAQAAYDALGNVDEGNYVYDEADARYIDLLRQIKDEKTWRKTAVDTHAVFYDTVRSIWPTEFHPFTTMPL